MKIITAAKYDKLPEEEKDYWLPHRWSKYKTVWKRDACFECGHKGEKYKEKAPARGAKPLSYYYSQFNVKVWGRMVQDLFSNTLILSDTKKQKIINRHENNK